MKIDQLIHNFFINGSPGTVSRVSVTSVDGHSFLWGYEWALYAYRDPRGNVTVYTGWEGYSATTSDHLHRIMPSHERFVAPVSTTTREVDGQPGYKGSLGLGEFDPDSRGELEEFGDEIVP